MKPMSEYTFIDVISPWLAFFVLALMVGYAEDWIHRHFFGIGYLLSNGDKMRAIVLFYAFFAPGVLVHEVVQYLVAGALSVPIKTVVAWPDEQKDGSMRLDFVVVKRAETDRIRAMLVAAAPFVVMGAMVWYISTEILDLHNFTASLGSGDFEVVVAELQKLSSTPDFFLWFYLLFVIANTMLPNEADAEGLPLILGGMALISALMIFFGVGNFLLETLGGSVAETLGRVNTALAGILVIDIAAIFLLGILESLVAWWRGYRIDYAAGTQKKAKTAAPKAREIGSDEPYPAGQPLPTIYNLPLPLPDPKASRED